MTTRGASGIVAERGAPPFELLESKLRPPQLLGGSVPRANLVNRLRDSRVPVIVVSAPPGYGKTTLLAQWATQSQRPFAWLTLDDHDNDPVVLLSYIAAALDRVSPLDPAVFDALASVDASIEATLVPRLGFGLARLQESFVLALDDLHVLTNPQCLDAIDALIDHIPLGSQLAMSGRGEPSRRIGALRARGLLLEIGPDELRMEPDDARDLLRGADVQLPDAEVATLVEHTEGWPAALYLAALSVQGGGEANLKDATAFRGDDRFVADYLRSEFLARLPPNELRFLTRTAVLDRMCGPLCDAVLKSKGSAGILESLQRSNRFVVALDRNREWYRCHHLLRELLRAELERAEPDPVPELLTRASEWSEGAGDTDAAVGYAQAAGDVERVAALVAAHSERHYNRGRAVTLERWYEWLERHGELDRNPQVAVIGAWLSALRGHPGKAERWADAAERTLRQEARPEGTALVEAWLAMFRAARCRHGVERMRADAESAARRFGRASPWWPTAAVWLGIALQLGGDAERADDTFVDMIDAATALEQWLAVSAGLAERAILAIERDDWVEAEALAERADSIVRQSRGEEYPQNALAYAVLARVAIHRGERPRANELLARAQRLRPRLTHALAAFSIQARLELARAYVSIADAPGARTVLREADGLMRRGPDFGDLAAQAEDLRSKLESARVEVPGATTLTTAELRLLPLLTTHLTFREIGERLYVSRHTVKSQATSIYRKLDVTSRGGAVERARELGLL
jgi:LuxR family maltose regulon positive regulatory protein